MCSNCFTAEIKPHGLQEWSELELGLLRKVDDGKMKKVKLNDGSDSLYTYQCLSCNEHWIFQHPVNNEGGSFMTLSTLLEKLRVPKWRRRLAIAVLVLTVVVVIIELLAGL